MKPSMLIVDDDADFLELLAGAMEARGFRCAGARDAAEAMTLIEQMRFSHAVLDLNLGPGDSGLVVLRYLLNVQPDCQAVMLTGFASIATAVEATRDGAVQYLPKPASADEIVAAFENPPREDPPIPDQPVSPKRLEWEYIHRALLRNRGNISATARELGMHRRTLQRKLAKRPPRR